MPLLLIVAAFTPLYGPPPQWWTWSVGRSVLLLLVSAAVGATGAALEASRLRVRRTESVLSVRAPASVVTMALWPSLVCALLTQVFAVGVIAATGGGLEGAIPWGMVGAVAAMLFFHTCLGFGLGSILRPVFGIPLALVASYSWLGFTGTVDWFELRHLSGLVLETCCDYEEQPMAASLVSATLFSLFGGIGLLLVACVALRLAGRHDDLLVGTTGATLVVGAAVVGLAVATGLGSTSAEPRDSDDLTCFPGEVTVCLFPEQVEADERSTDRDVASLPTRVSALIRRARTAGVDLPTRATTYLGREDDPHVVRVIYQEGMTDELLAASLASDVPQGFCASDDGDEAHQRETSRAVAIAQLRAIMLGRDATMDDIDDLYGQAAATLEAVVALPLGAQAAWVNEVIAALDDCALHPPVP